MTDPLSGDATCAALRLRLLSSDHVRLVYEAVLERLSETGVAACPAAREGLFAAGAVGTGGPAGARVRVPAELVEAAAARAPKRVVLGARSAVFDVVAGTGACLLGAGGAPTVRTLPLAGGPTRRASPDDLREACRLADALPEVALVVGPPLATGDPGDDRARLADIDLALRSTVKHVQLTGYLSVGAAETAVAVTEGIRDGEAAVRERPPLSLVGGAEAFAAATVFARRGLPVGVPAAYVGGETAPGEAARPQASGTRNATVASLPHAGLTEALVEYLAALLAGNVAVQALAPGAAFVAPVWPALAGVPATGAAANVFTVAGLQLLAHAGLPATAVAFATDAGDVDWRASTDASFGALSSALAGAVTVTGAGTVLRGSAFSLRQLVADAEIHSWCATIAAGIRVDDDTLGIDAIKHVGVGGNFLGQKHTRTHMKDVWRPRLLDRGSWDGWVAGGRRGAGEMAAELAGVLLAEHDVDPLDAGRSAVLERIIATSGL